MPVGRSKRESVLRRRRQRSGNSTWLSSDHVIPSLQESDFVKLVDDGHMTSDNRGVGVEFVMEMDMVCMSTCFGDILTCNAQTLEVPKSRKYEI